jgi:hypothetical protein
MAWREDIYNSQIGQPKDLSPILLANKQVSDFTAQATLYAI